MVTEGRLEAVVGSNINGVQFNMLAIESLFAGFLEIGMDTVNVVGDVAMQPHSPRLLRWLIVTKQHWKSGPEVEKRQACDNVPKLRNFRVGSHPFLCETFFVQPSLHVAGPRGGQFLRVRGT